MTQKPRPDSYSITNDLKKKFDDTLESYGHSKSQLLRDFIERFISDPRDTEKWLYPKKKKS